jgi:phage protein D
VEKTADVRQPAFKVVYEGTDITEDISRDVVQIFYEDAEGDESDELRITVDDMFAKWKDEWRPNRGDRIKLSMGYMGEGLADFGTFEIDEVHYRGQPDVVEFRSLSVGIDNELWTKRSQAYDNATIFEVAKDIAQRNNLQLIYDYKGESLSTAATASLRSYPIMNLRHRRLYQDRETDLRFLNRVANRYGIKFSVKGAFLSYLHVYELNTIAPVMNLFIQERRMMEGLRPRFEMSPLLETDEINEIEDIVSRPRPELKSYDLRDCQDKDAAGVDVINFNPYNQEGFIFKMNSGADLRAKLGENFPNFARAIGDLRYLEEKRNSNEAERLKRRLKVYEEVDNLKQAEAIAMARLFEAATSSVEGSLEFEGTPVVQAGTNIQVRGLRWLDGKYHVTKSWHRIDRASGYTTRVDVKMVGLLD